jgi:hypothetical protein
MINAAAEFSVIAKFLIAVLALSVSYVTVMGMVFKYEGGLYAEHMIPATVTDDMRRARRFFLKAIFVCLAVSALAGYGLTLVMDPVSWHNIVMPALAGIGFGMLYGGTTRFDRIRPRDRV